MQYSFDQIVENRNLYRFVLIQFSKLGFHGKDSIESILTTSEDYRKILEIMIGYYNMEK